MKKRVTGKSFLRKGNDFLLVILAVLVCMPIIMTILASIKSGWELSDSLLPVLSETGEKVHWKLLPAYPTFRHYFKLLLETPQFFTVFWNSVKITVPILLGQLVVSVPAGWAFAHFSFPFKKVVILLYIVLMLMPFQVTMLPSYFVMNQLNLMDTQASVIIPAIFSTFPVFIIYRGFQAIPIEIIEAARVDGAGDFTIFRKIGIPLGMSGILSALVLGFLEYWNMMEQPLAFIRDKSLWPMSLYLPEIESSQAGIALASSVIVLIPAYFVFALGQDYLEQGIISSGIKK